MSKTEIVSVGTPFPKITAVAPLDGLCIIVTWKTGKQVVVDLAPTIFTFKVYAPLREDRALFETVHVVNASVIAWGEDEAIDMHVSEIERLSETIMDAADFQTFLKDMDLTWEAAAAQLGMSRRTVGYYTKGREIPRYIALACAHLQSLRTKPADAVAASQGKGEGRVSGVTYRTVGESELPEMPEMVMIGDTRLNVGRIVMVESIGAGALRARAVRVAKIKRPHPSRTS